MIGSLAATAAVLAGTILAWIARSRIGRKWLDPGGRGVGRAGAGDRSGGDLAVELAQAPC